MVLARHVVPRKRSLEKPTEAIASAPFWKVGPNDEFFLGTNLARRLPPTFQDVKLNSVTKPWVQVTNDEYADDAHHETLLKIALDFLDVSQNRIDLRKGMLKALGLRNVFWDWTHNCARQGRLDS